MRTDNKATSNWKTVLFITASATVLCGCYALRSSDGGGQTTFTPPREVHAEGVALAEGYAIEAVASGLTFPTGAAFDEQNRLHVVESGYSYGPHRDCFVSSRMARWWWLQAAAKTAPGPA